MKSKLTCFIAALSLLFMGFSYAQEKTITGNVTDQDGLPLPGVNVVVVGTTNGVQTDFDGNYSIIANLGNVLRFSYLGQQSVDRTVGAPSTIDVQMQESAEALDEVVVTALGIERKPRELSYSVGKVDNDQLTETRAVNAATAMVGKVSGMQVNTIGNGVNPETRIVLRGNRSLLGNNQALVVIDGYPSPRGALDRLNPDDIQEVTILKGANASALYGSEATNGVVIVTTKKGTGKLNVTFTTTAQEDEVTYLPELQNIFGTGGFPDGTVRALENVQWGPRYDGRLVDASETYPDGSVWQVPYTPIPGNHKSFFQTGSTLRYGVTMNGGDENGDFLLSVDQSNVKGVVPKDAYNQTNIRLKGSRKFDKLEVGGNLSFFRSHANVVGSGGHQSRPLYWYILNTPPHIPLTEEKNWRNGEFTRNEMSYYRFYENPWFIVDTQRDKTDISAFTLIANAKYNFTDWLSANLKVGYDSFSSQYKQEHGGLKNAFEVPGVYAQIADFGPSTFNRIVNSYRVNSDFIVTFDKDIAEDFHATVNVGQNVHVENSNLVQVSGGNLIIPDFYNVSTRTGNLEGAESTTDYRRWGLYGDLTFGFKDYIFLNLSGRNDWSSALPDGNNSYFYPGAGISFVPTDAFEGMKGTLRYLKLRYSWTRTGNDPLPYAANSTFSAPTGFPYGTTVGLSLSNRDPDPNLKPEFTTSQEVGLEFALFNGDRLSGTIAAYQTNTTDQIVPINTSVTSGATSILTNIGEIQNQGIEVDLSGGIIATQDFSWKLGVHYSLNKSEVISLSPGVDEIEVGSYYLDGPGYGAVIVAKIGEPYPLLKTSDYQRDDLGRVIVGANGDPLEDSDLRIQGKTTPDYILGLSTSFKYKGFSLYAVADYRTGHIFYNNIVDALEFTGLTQHSVTSNRQPFVFPNSVYSDGNGGYVPNTSRPTTSGGNAFWSVYGDTKSNYVTDATVLKLRELSLSYTFGPELIKSLKLQDLRLGLYGRNLFMWRPADNVYTDPEFNFDSGNAVGFGTQSQTPPTRQYGVTVTAKF